MNLNLFKFILLQFRHLIIVKKQLTMMKKNLIANFLGQGWTALMSLAFVPFYIKYLGIESYGLIGLFAMLQAWFALLDMGMSPSLNREMARFTAGSHSATSIRDLLRSIEIIVLIVAILLVLGTWGASGWLANNWLQAEKLPADVIAQAFTIMGTVTALRFVESVYHSAIIGLQKQVLYNIVISAMATLRGLGAVGILMWISPTIKAFFIWQGLVSLFSLGLLAIITYRALPKIERAGRFSMLALSGIGKFAGGMMGITFLALILTQVDKILLSKLLSLSDFGYYTLANTVAGSLLLLTIPITQSLFPRLSELHATNNQPELIRKYHQGAQFVSVLMGSAAIIVIIFAESILQLWTGDIELAGKTSSILSILAIGTMLNGLMGIPYQTQLAHGWTSLTAWVNVVSVAIIVPSILWAVPQYGAKGAAWIWVILNAGYVFLAAHFMYRKILTQEKWHWYWQDILKPLFAALIVAVVFDLFMPNVMTKGWNFIYLLAASVTTLLGAALSAPMVRKYFPFVP
ncbi:MAG: oligosaccharide flippase family protein [Magnetococcus sp. THC-1_WYH]